ncbi:hypothetical protein ENBRE01_2831, partial [Enteropsectra breve]
MECKKHNMSHKGSEEEGGEAGKNINNKVYIADYFDKYKAEAALGLLKIKRMFKDRTYVEHGYTYKTNLQLKVLNAILQRTAYPSSETRENIAIVLNMNPRSVQIWFQNA